MTVLKTDAFAELLTERKERNRLYSQTGIAGIVVIIIEIVAAIVDWSTVWPLVKMLGGWWATFYVFRSMLAWHRIEKAGKGL